MSTNDAVTREQVVKWAFTVDPKGERRITGCAVDDLMQFANLARASAFNEGIEAAIAATDNSWDCVAAIEAIRALKLPEVGNG